MKNAPPSLLSKLYQFWSPHVDQEEFGYYERLVKESKGAALELASGGGRILLPLLQKGYEVDGVEPSQEMRTLIRERGNRLNLSPKIYEQRLESVEIKGKFYKLIYCALGSFQFIVNPIDVKIALDKYRALLGDGGTLVLALFLPWSEAPLYANGLWRIASDQIDRKTKTRYILREQTYHDPVEQVLLCNTRFEIWQGKDLLEMYPRMLHFRWYSKGEITLLLEQAGFTSIAIRRTYQEGVTPGDSLMLVEART